MKGIHVWWSKIGIQQGYTKENYYIEDYNLLILFLSCLYWKQHNKELVLYTDDVMLSFLEKYNILDLELWTEINTDVIANIPKYVHPIINWSAANVVVIESLKAPFCMLDTDLIYRKKFSTKADLICGHKEKLVYPVYPELRLFIDDLTPYQKYTWKQDPFNASFLCFNNQELIDEYSKLATNFIFDSLQQIPKNFDYLNIRSNFVDQRLLGEIAAKYKSHSLIHDMYYPFTDNVPIWRAENVQKSNYGKYKSIMTHIWSEKKLIARYRSVYHKHMITYLRELQQCFPNQYEPIVQILQSLSKKSLPNFYL